MRDIPGGRDWDPTGYPPVKWNPVYTILSIGARLWAEFNHSGVGSIWP
jgi:hypothetical protein